MFRAYWRKLDQDRIDKLKMEMKDKTLFEQMNILTKAMEFERTFFKLREYTRHFQIITIDMTQQEYGVPKVTFSGGKHSTLAFPHKIRIHVKAKHGDKEFTSDVGGIELTQTRSRGLW